MKFFVRRRIVALTALFFVAAAAGCARLPIDAPEAQPGDTSNETADAAPAQQAVDASRQLETADAASLPLAPDSASILADSGVSASRVISAEADGGSQLAPGAYLVAIDTATRTYVDYVQVSSDGTWSPAVNGWPALAQWQQDTSARGLRFMPFAPGDTPSVSDIEAFLPVTAPATHSIDITASPYNAAPDPADATSSILAALTAAGALATATEPVDVVVPPGTYNYSAVLEVGANVRLRGTGGILHSTQPAASAVHLGGDRSGALFLTLTSSATERGSTPDCSGIWVGARGPSGTPVHDTLVVGDEVVQPMGAHVFGIEEIGGLWAFNYAHDGFADTFHHTGRSSFCQVVANRASGLPGRGDDLYAFVGYANDDDPVHHCSCIANWGRNGNARGLATVGAAYVTLQDNDIAETQAAGIYIARESAFTSFGSFNISVLRNRIADANLSASHDGLLAYADVPDGSTNSLTFGSVPNEVRNLDVENNTFNATSPGIGNGFGIEIRNSCAGGDVIGNAVTQSKAPGIIVNGAGFATSMNTFSP